jgi:hypothetical protein
VGASAVGGVGGEGTGPRARRVASGGRRLPMGLAVLAIVVVASGCGLHVSKNGVSGEVFGHSFSAAKGQLPAGFPKSVPQPAASRVLGGGGADGRFDVAYAVTGTISAGTAAYQATLQSAGFAISNIETGSTEVTQPPATGSTSGGSTSTTLTLTGSTFMAKDAQWTVQVESGTSSSVKGTGLKSGEFAINATVVPANSGTTTTG